MTGNYSGTLNSTLNPASIPFTVSAVVTQASDYSITGSASITNSTCFTTLTFGQGSQAVGGAFYLVDSTNGITINVVPNEDGTLSLTAPFYASYQVSAGACTGDKGSGTATEQ